MNPHKITEMFEKELARYCGAPYAVAVTSCTMAILLSCNWYFRVHGTRALSIPKHTYCSVPQSIIHAGGSVEFRNEKWIGEYQLYPSPIWDCARWLRADMYKPGTFMALSFHWSKHLALGQGGAILCDDIEAYRYFVRIRFDGRTPGVEPIDDSFPYLGWHCYMSPKDAADGLSRLALLPRDNQPLPNSNYPDLSQFEALHGKP